MKKYFYNIELVWYDASIPDNTKLIFKNFKFTTPEEVEERFNELCENYDPIPDDFRIYLSEDEYWKSVE